MKVGILTLHGSVNYGEFLQSYGLSKFLEGMGHEVEMIIFDNSKNAPSVLRRLMGVLTSYTVREMLGLLRRVKTRSKDFQSPSRTDFEMFCRAHLRYTDPVCTQNLDALCRQYDALVVGSDQVWTDMYSKRLPYFLEGLGSYKGLKLSYAACSAHVKAPIYARARIRTLLRTFSVLSVRDKTTAQLVTSLGLSAPEIVADPTLLYDFEIKETMVLPENYKYIFCYSLGGPLQEGHARIIDMIKAKFGDLHVVTAGYADCNLVKIADINLTSPNPTEWVNLLRNSAFVYTDSFHATLFALRYHKELLAWITDTVRASRLKDLASAYDLNHRIIRSVKFLNLYKPINWEQIDHKLSSLISKSKELLSKTLSSYEQALQQDSKAHRI